MKKTILLYFFLIVSIPCWALLCNIEFAHFGTITFSRVSHVVFEVLNSILLFLTFIYAQKLYKQTSDERLLILSYGFLIALIFNSVHIFTVRAFPFDNLSVMNITNNPSLVYLFLGNLIIPLSINFSLMYKPFSISQAKLHIAYFYTSLFMILLVVPVIIYFVFPKSADFFYLAIHTLEYVSYALYFMIAAILISLKKNGQAWSPNYFIMGLLFLGFSGIAYINPGLFQISGITAHAMQTVGFLFLLIGLVNFQDLCKSYTLKDDIVCYLSLVIVGLYVVMIPILSALFGIVIPRISGYIFIEILLCFQLVIYILSSLFWNKVVNIYLSAESFKALTRIMESINRVSEPNIVKNTIVSEINRIYRPDRCIIVLLDKTTNSFFLDEYAKFLPSKTLLNAENVKHEANDFDNFQSIFKNIEVNFPTLNEFLQRTSGYGSKQEQWLKNHKIKSLYTIPITDNQQLLGYIILYFIKESYALSEEDYEFLKKVALQLAKVIKNQNIQ